jgi:hypothetical protein
MTAYDNGFDSTQDSQRGCFFYGCITVVILVVVGGLIAGGIFYYAKSNVEPYCESYLSLVQQQKYEEVYSNLAPGWKNAQTLEQYIEFEKGIARYIGNIKDKTMMNVNIQSTGGGTVAEIVYDAEYSIAKNVKLTFTLVSSGDIWLVQGLYYGAPELANPKTCPKCKGKAGLMVKFCPSCGASLDEKEEVK